MRNKKTKMLEKSESAAEKTPEKILTLKTLKSEVYSIKDLGDELLIYLH